MSAPLVFDQEVQRLVNAGVGEDAAIKHVRKTMPYAAIAKDHDSAKRADVAEKAEQAFIVKLLRAFGFEVYSTSQARASRVSVGLPDLYAIHTRRPLAAWIEVKRSVGGRISEPQQRFADLCRGAGVRHLLGDRHVVEAWLVSEKLAERLHGVLERPR